MADRPMGHMDDIGAVATRNDVRGMPARRLSWSAIFAGLIIAAVLQIVLTVLGLAIGFGSVAGGGAAKSVGIGAGVWAIVSALISLFVGAFVTGRMASPRVKRSGALHGFVLWGLSALVTVWLVANGVTSLAGGAFQLTSNVLGGTAAGATQGAAQLGAAAAARPSDARRAATNVDSAGRALQAQADSAAERIQSAAGEVAMNASGAASRGAWLALVGLILTAAAGAIGAAAGTRELDAGEHTARM